MLCAPPCQPARAGPAGTAGLGPGLARQSLGLGRPRGSWAVGSAELQRWAGWFPQEGQENVEILPSGERQQANQKRITTPYMTKYERARVLGTRALQIA